MFSNGLERVVNKVELVSIKIPAYKLEPFDIHVIEGGFNKDLLESYQERAATIRECNSRLASLKEFSG